MICIFRATLLISAFPFCLCCFQASQNHLKLLCSPLVLSVKTHSGAGGGHNTSRIHVFLEIFARPDMRLARYATRRALPRTHMSPPRFKRSVVALDGGAFFLVSVHSCVARQWLSLLCWIFFVFFQIIYVTGGQDLTVTSTAPSSVMSNVRFEVSGFSKLVLDIPGLTMAGIYKSVRARGAVRTSIVSGVRVVVADGGGGPQCVRRVSVGHWKRHGHHNTNSRGNNNNVVPSQGVFLTTSLPRQRA